jgi:hypothetical protein
MAPKPEGGRAQVPEQRQKKSRVDYTHFLSIPIHTTEFKQNYEKLKSNIVQKSIRNVSASCFMNPSLLHITILMLDLKDKKRFDLAKQVLQSLEGDI